MPAVDENEDKNVQLTTRGRGQDFTWSLHGREGCQAMGSSMIPEEEMGNHSLRHGGLPW